MTGLLIALAILIFILLLLHIKIKIVIDFGGEDVNLFLKILGIKITLMPKKDKKKKLKINDYSYKKINKKKKEKPKKPEKKKPDVASSHDSGMSLGDKISLITDIVKHLVKKFFGHLRIDITKIKINVGSPDAAKTAILYGVISQALAALIDVLSAITDVRNDKNADISVNADFTSEKTKAYIYMSFSLRVRHIFSIAFSTLFRAIGRMIKANNK